MKRMAKSNAPSPYYYNEKEEEEEEEISLQRRNEAKTRKSSTEGRKNVKKEIKTLFPFWDYFHSLTKIWNTFMNK